ncbi:MAG: flagella basal body P-ring formation protein FlgA [gamma proteobacterium symbiont of Ctena orbiculata]|nr:MAG: flagella basal body P-ring formation protein FlgA [gamma proteobacterium symbiont of Ctena orbiculata]PVV19589.1 MAG: flagella basal body P-ring formation protein FlgA [gamma proteobacterium symbiont of Ctena orbiculata]PVV27725.1 MAG: flagella basal body P-ring formation protein FlgA [gamma proteobacterium symbiont of Ctena orbiculata]
MLRKKVIIETLLAMLLFTATAISHGANGLHQSHDSIADAVKEYLLQSVAKQNSHAKIVITPLDHRLKLSQCDSPLQTFSPPGGSKMGRTSVGVRCESPAPWSLYVSAKVGLELPVVIATRDLARGQAITKADVKLEISDTTHLLRGYYESVDEIVGRTLKRTLRRGKVVTPSLLVVQKTVARGEQVTILAAAGNIEVRMQGKAMKNGNPGDLIPVVNVKSKKKLQARVISEGLVRVD